jgi:NDP-sugar pyrophosphorylase family protein
MTVIVTMAGMGSRFRNEGYLLSKHMIRARGKTLFEWSMQSLTEFYDHHFIFACLTVHDTQWIKQCAKHLGIHNVTVVSRDEISSGQAQTAYDVIRHASSKDPIWIFNIDTYIDQGLTPLKFEGAQGCIYVFESCSPSMSFVRYDENDKVVELAEKKVISNWATVGVYGFQSADLYKEIYKEAYHLGAVKEVSGEQYIAPMYQLMLSKGMTLLAPKLLASSVHILGTPNEVRFFDPNVKPPYGALD